MEELIGKIWFFLFVMPFMIGQEAYAKLKNFLSKHNYKPEWMYILFIGLIILLIILLLAGYR
jgi:undecaprenyl pyrophosphate phosphatase UppP